MNGKKWNRKGIFENKIIYILKEGKETVNQFDELFVKLSYEGECLNGQRNGKEYNFDGNLSFEGEYLNGKRWNGKGYLIGNISYELINGKGNIKDYLNYIKYEGEYANGKQKWNRNRI